MNALQDKIKNLESFNFKLNNNKNIKYEKIIKDLNENYKNEINNMQSD